MRFHVLVFQTKEIGRIVTHRLSARDGGLGDITATREGLVVSGQFDLKTPEAQAEFLEAVKMALATIPSLQPGAANPENAPEGPRGSPKVATVEVTPLEAAANALDAAATEVFRHQPSVLAKAFAQEEPLTVGRRGLRTQKEFNTVAAKSGDDGEEKFYCALCYEILAPAALGWIFAAGSVTQIGIYSPFGHQDDDLPMILEASANPRHGAFGDVKLTQGETWIHNCASLSEQKFRTVFRLPALVPRASP